MGNAESQEEFAHVGGAMHTPLYEEAVRYHHDEEEQEPLAYMKYKDHGSSPLFQQRAQYNAESTSSSYGLFDGLQNCPLFLQRAASKPSSSEATGVTLGASESCPFNIMRSMYGSEGAAGAPSSWMEGIRSTPFYKMRLMSTGGEPELPTFLLMPFPAEPEPVGGTIAFTTEGPDKPLQQGAVDTHRPAEPELPSFLLAPVPAKPAAVESGNTPFDIQRRTYSPSDGASGMDIPKAREAQSAPFFKSMLEAAQKEGGDGGMGAAGVGAQFAPNAPFFQLMRMYGGEGAAGAPSSWMEGIRSTPFYKMRLMSTGGEPEPPAFLLVPVPAEPEVVESVVAAIASATSSKGNTPFDIQRRTYSPSDGASGMDIPKAREAQSAPFFKSMLEAAQKEGGDGGMGAAGVGAQFAPNAPFFQLMRMYGGEGAAGAPSSWMEGIRSTPFYKMRLMSTGGEPEPPAFLLVPVPAEPEVVESVVAAIASATSSKGNTPFDIQRRTYSPSDGASGMDIPKARDAQSAPFFKSMLEAAQKEGGGGGMGASGVGAQFAPNAPFFQLMRMYGGEGAAGAPSSWMEGIRSTPFYKMRLVSTGGEPALPAFLVEPVAAEPEDVESVVAAIASATSSKGNTPFDIQRRTYSPSDGASGMDIPKAREAQSAPFFKSMLEAAQKEGGDGGMGAAGVGAQFAPNAPFFQLMRMYGGEGAAGAPSSWMEGVRSTPFYKMRLVSTGGEAALPAFLVEPAALAPEAAAPAPPAEEAGPPRTSSSKGNTPWERRATAAASGGGGGGAPAAPAAAGRRHNAPHFQRQAAAGPAAAAEAPAAAAGAGGGRGAAPYFLQREASARQGGGGPAPAVGGRGPNRNAPHLQRMASAGGAAKPHHPPEEETEEEVQQQARLVEQSMAEEEEDKGNPFIDLVMRCCMVR